ncbi:hypothetical protein [Candidatus Hepatobacter penaei]|uniref:hypothetical protein n=1 Tax=Candidatus Hepatobacter penaei TaxID=1274402 RepID=UPI0004F26914|nr:hypothetical protein [Candidatus Hepatobacter penaei]
MNSKKTPNSFLSFAQAHRQSMAAGLLAAVFLGVGLYSPLGLFFLTLSPVPLLFLVCGKSDEDFFVASAVGALFLLFFGSAYHTLCFLILCFLPALLALLVRTKPRGRRSAPRTRLIENYPFEVKVVYLWVAFACVLAFLFSYIQVGVDDVMPLVSGSLSEKQRLGIVRLWPYFPSVVALFWFFALWLNLFFAAHWVKRYVKQPWVALSFQDWQVPPVFYVLFLSTLFLGTFWVEKMMWMNMFLVLSSVFVIDGLLTLRSVFSYWKTPVIFHVVLGLSILFVLPLLFAAILGLVEPVIGLRKRLDG